jgi:HK97 family phage prohead protease
MDETLTLPDLDIVRTTLFPVAWRDATADEVEAAAEADTDVLGVMEVHFSPFNVWYEVNSWWEGRFLERTVPGAFKRTIGQHNDPNSSHNMKTLFQHGMDFHIGDKLLGDIADLREAKASPISTVNLWDTSYNRDLLPGLKRGSYGSSFMFRVTKESWDNEPEPSDYNPEGLPERTIRETSTFEAGPVTWPASPTASAGMRCASGTDAYYDHLARRDPERVQRMRETFTALRSAGRLAPGARLRDALAPDTATDSAGSRSGGPNAAARARRIREARLAALRS